MRLLPPASESPKWRTFPASVVVVGELRGWVADLDAAWRADVERTRVIVEPANTLVTY